MKASNNWKKQLNSRKIDPSEEAWLAIEAGLETKSKNKLKRTYLISILAACSIGFIVFVSLPSLDKTSAASIVEHTSTNIQEPVFPEALFITKYATTPYQKKDSAVEPNTISIASIVKPSNVNAKTIDEVPILNTELSTEISSKAETLLAEVETELSLNKKDSQQKSTDVEVDQLLANAQLLIEKTDYNQLYDYALSENLLADVEKDLSKNKLQDKVWQFVKENVQNLESAIVSLR